MYKSKNTVIPHFEVYRDNLPYKTLNSCGDGTVRMDAESELKMSFSGTFYKYEGVNFLTDRLKVSVEINGKNYPLGVYCVTTEIPNSENGVGTVKIEAYSLLWILKQTKTEDLFFFPKNTGYIGMIQTMLTRAGIKRFSGDESTARFQTDREDWSIGTSYLTIINDLLDEINYNPLYVDNDGIVKFAKYTNPTMSAVKYSYSAGKDSVIKNHYTLTSDIYNKSNIFIAICDNPDIDGTLRAVSVNDDPRSPYSIVNIGRRIPYIERVNNTPSLSELQIYADNLKTKSMQTNEVIEYETAIVPTHGIYETVQIDLGGVTGIFIETAWEIDLSFGGTMKHTGRRIIE